MDFKTFAHESLALRDHPGRAYGHTAEQRQQFYEDVGAFLDQLAQMRSGLECREDADEVQAMMVRMKTEHDPMVLQPHWAMMSGNAKIAIALRYLLSVYKVTFPADHPATQQGWDRVSELQNLIISANPQKFKTRAELTA